MTDLQYTPIEDIEKIYDELKAGFASGKSKSIAYRKYQLLQLMYALSDNMERWDKALNSDLGRPLLESRFLELTPTLSEIKRQHDNVDKWAKPEKPPFTITWTPFRPTIAKEPKGTVLLVNPFNYPVWVNLVPLAGAIAAGCTVLVKPSEQTPACSSLFAELLHKYLDNDIVRVVNGAVPETTRLLELRWDHIFYTGSERVGRIVMEAAAKHLTPLTLELGGKSPVVIDPKCDIKTTGRRLLWGKIANAGQTCLAPDYVLVPRKFQDELVRALEKFHSEFYPEGDPSKPDVCTRIISQRATARIGGLLKKTQGKIVFGGTVDEEKKYIAPTVVRDVPINDSLMSEEIFGPVLSIVPVDNIDEAIKIIGQHPNPLVVYVFSEDEKFKKRIFDQTRAGAFVVNESIIHPGAQGLPFGGIGNSGFGQYTGKFTFDTFTHQKAMIESPSWIDRILSFRFPPYTDRKVSKAMRLSDSLPPRPRGPPVERPKGIWFRRMLFAAFTAIVGLLLRRKTFQKIFS